MLKQSHDHTSSGYDPDLGRQALSKATSKLIKGLELRKKQSRQSKVSGTITHVGGVDSPAVSIRLQDDAPSHRGSSTLDGRKVKKQGICTVSGIWPCCD